MKKFKKILCAEINELINEILIKFKQCNKFNVNINFEIKNCGENNLISKIYVSNLNSEKVKTKLLNVYIQKINELVIVERNRYIKHISDDKDVNVNIGDSAEFCSNIFDFDSKHFNSVSDYVHDKELNLAYKNYQKGHVYYNVNDKKNRVLPKNVYIDPEHRMRIKNELQLKFDASYLKIFEYRYNENFANRLDVNLICDKVHLSPPGVYRKLYKIAKLYDATK